MISLGLAALAYAQTGSVYFKEEFNYASLDKMQEAGWTLTRPAGISVSSGTVVLNGVGGDCSIHFSKNFPTGKYDWKVEAKGMWLGHGHSVLSVFVGTERHSYGWAADGYYNYFSFYRDSKKILQFGSYQEKANQYVALTMIRQANTFSFYFDGVLQNTYIEEDTQPSAVTSLDMVSPWQGDAKYDYVQIGETNAAFASSQPTISTGSFPMVPVLIGGGVIATLVGGVLVYYYVIVGGSHGGGGGSGPGSNSPNSGSPNTGPPASTPPGQITAGSGPGGPPTAPFATPTTAPFTTPTTAPGTVPSTAPYTTPTTSPGTTPTTAPFTTPTTAPFTTPTTSPGTTPATAPGTSPTTAPYSSPTSAPGTVPATAPYATPTTSPGTTPTTASQIIPTPPPTPSINTAAKIITEYFKGVWKNTIVSKSTIINQLTNLGMSNANAQKVIDKLVEEGIIKITNPGYYTAV
jgi:hypothetical protein